MISAVVSGNLGKDARVGEAGDTPVVNFSIASRRYDSKNKEEVTDWVDVAFFGTRAAKIAEYLTKGSRVAVRGSLYQREYQHDGKTRYSLTMRADDVELMGSKQDGQKREPGSDDGLPDWAKD